MVEIHAEIVSESEVAQRMQQGLTRSSNVVLTPNLGAPNTIFERKPDYYVRVFSISKQSFHVNQPLFKNKTLPGCPDGIPYIEVACFPNIVVERFVAAETGQVHPNEYSGERIAMDLICPANAGIDMDAVLSTEALSAGAGTTDLIKRGLFFIRGYAEPTDEDLKKARLRMEKYYRELIAQANNLARSGKQGNITQEMHVAGDYFKIKESWHAVVEHPTICPNCGEDIKQGIAYHRTAENRICVIDWQRTVNAGVKTREQVPAESRWWTPADYTRK